MEFVRKTHLLLVELDQGRSLGVVSVEAGLERLGVVVRPADQGFSGDLKSGITIINTSQTI